MSNASKQPDHLTFTCPLTVEAGEGGKETPRFSMVAYTGGMMRITGFPHPVVVDLEGLAVERQDIPVRLDHNPRQGVGHTQRVAIENGQVLAEGLISRDTSWARDVAKSGTNGFPWQASIGAAVVEAEFIPNGGHVTVNGRTFDGPLHVVRRAILKEISFVDSGADTNTQARIAAQDNTQPKEHASMDGTQDTTTQDQATDTTTPAPSAEPKDTPPANPPTATAPQASTPTPRTSAVVQAAADEDPVAKVRQRMADELRRVDAIRKVCAGKHATIEAKAIEEGWDATQAELHVLRASRPQVPRPCTRRASRPARRSSRPSP